jgi:hypothetical protein
MAQHEFFNNNFKILSDFKEADYNSFSEKAIFLQHLELP